MADLMLFSLNGSIGCWRDVGELLGWVNSLHGRFLDASGVLEAGETGTAAGPWLSKAAPFGVTSRWRTLAGKVRMPGIVKE